MASPTLQEIVEEIDQELYDLGEQLHEYAEQIKHLRMLSRQAQGQSRSLRAQKQTILKRIDAEEKERSLQPV
jgi:flagellar biosynthesis/type III secretory pathway chaperone